GAREERVGVRGLLGAVSGPLPGRHRDPGPHDRVARAAAARMSDTERNRILVYGATGFTGRLVVDEARRRGVEPVLAGRSRRALDELADAVGGAEVRAADVAQPAALAGLFDGIAAVINCAGPFARLGEPVLRAAITAGAHYLDTTGEQLWMA